MTRMEEFKGLDGREQEIARDLFLGSLPVFSQPSAFEDMYGERGIRVSDQKSGEAVRPERSVDAGPIETDDDVAGQVDDGDPTLA